MVAAAVVVVGWGGRFVLTLFCSNDRIIAGTPRSRFRKARCDVNVDLVDDFGPVALYPGEGVVALRAESVRRWVLGQFGWGGRWAGCAGRPAASPEANPGVNSPACKGRQRLPAHTEDA
jgi:hypothetical protein